MQSTDSNEKIHMGRNVKRFREMLGIKQEALALELGDDWNQKKISLIEQKETIDDALLEEISKVLKIPVTSIKTLTEEAVYNFINNFNDNSINHGPLNNYNCTFNLLDKIVELYEALVKSEKEKVEMLQKMLEEKK